LKPGKVSEGDVIYGRRIGQREEKTRAVKEKIEQREKEYSKDEK